LEHVARDFECDFDYDQETVPCVRGSDGSSHWRSGYDDGDVLRDSYDLNDLIGSRHSVYSYSAWNYATRAV